MIPTHICIITTYWPHTWSAPLHFVIYDYVCHLPSGAINHCMLQAACSATYTTVHATGMGVTFPSSSLRLLSHQLSASVYFSTAKLLSDGLCCMSECTCVQESWGVKGGHHTQELGHIACILGHVNLQHIVCMVIVTEKVCDFCSQLYQLFEDCCVYLEKNTFKIL